MQDHDFLAYRLEPNNWIPQQVLAERLEHWDYKRLRNVTERRKTNGLAPACRRDGKRLLINQPLFALWLSGVKLPETGQ